MQGMRTTNFRVVANREEEVACKILGLFDFLNQQWLLISSPYDMNIISCALII